MTDQAATVTDRSRDKKRVRLVALIWVRKLWRDLTEPQQGLIRNALGDLPLEPSCGTLAVLYERLAREEIGMMVLPEQDGMPAAVSLFELVRFCDGSLNYDSLCTVAVGNVNRNLTDLDMTIMESLARSCGCSSMSMRTIRPGLVYKLVEVHGWYLSEMIVRKKLE